MIKVNKVISGSSVAGDGTALQPAAPLSPEIRTQLFDEFTNQDPPAGGSAATPASSQTIFFAVILAAVLAGIALYVIKQVKPDELEKFKDTK